MLETVERILSFNDALTMILRIYKIAVLKSTVDISDATD